MLNKKTRRRMRKIIQDIYRTPIVKNNQGRNPYLKALEHGEKWLREMRENPSPNFAPYQILIKPCFDCTSSFLVDGRVIVQEEKVRGGEEKNL